jgi:D-serine deaminase-like pyridoxal phosphate-dependent protein
MSSDPFADIQKPTLLLDEARARANIARMAEKARRQGVRFRPHFKTHQSAEIGEWFREQGVDKITVSSLDMAEYFAAADWDEITLAFPANLRQLAGLSALARRVKLGLLVESPESAAALAQGLDGPAEVWLKVDVGLHRTGLAWDRPEAARAVIAALQGAPQLRLAGLLTHAGHTYTAPSPQAVRQIYAETLARLGALRGGLGMEDLQISVGDTPGCSLVEDFGPVQEIRPGNFVFYDAEQYLLGACAWEQVAVAVACPVVALHPERQEAVIYGGAIHLGKDFMPYAGQPAYGLVAFPQGRGWGEPIPGAFVRLLSQEHGVLHLPEEALSKVGVGELLMVIPAHSCLTVTALGQYRTLDGKRIGTMGRL